MLIESIFHGMRIHFFSTKTKSRVFIYRVCTRKPMIVCTKRKQKETTNKLIIQSYNCMCEFHSIFLPNNNFQWRSSSKLSQGKTHKG